MRLTGFEEEEEKEETTIHLHLFNITEDPIEPLEV